MLPKTQVQTFLFEKFRQFGWLNYTDVKQVILII